MSVSPGSGIAFVAPPLARGLRADQVEATAGLQARWARARPETSSALATGLPISAAIAAGTLAAVQRRSRRGSSSRPPPAQEDEDWIRGLDLKAFADEVEALGERLRQEQGPEDMRHLRRVVLWSDLLAVVGLGSLWMSPNPITVLALSLWTHARWTMVGHHVIHGGYNRIDASGHYSSRSFAVGSLWRRAVDWFDWMLPEAWSAYHNQIHHYRVNEPADPDFFEKYTDTWKLNREFMTGLSMLFFKWAFAAPNTFKALKLAERRRRGEPMPEGFDPKMTMTIYQVFHLESLGQGVYTAKELLMRVIGPYLLLHFFVLPLPLLIAGPSFFWHGVANLFLAELVANVHGFFVTTFNHTGEDVYRFERGCAPKSPTFYLRAVIGSVNCSTGGELNDFLHGYLNYQIEHHLWPDLSMLSYQKAQPQVKAICEKHGVPYIQENIFVRMSKVLKIFTGRARMRRFPDHLEREEDILDWDGRSSAATDDGSLEAPRLVVS